VALQEAQGVTLFSACCCGGGCGSDFGAIRPYSETSYFTYEVIGFSQPYGPESLLATYKVSDMELIESPSIIETRCTYVDLRCCGLAYPMDILDQFGNPVTITCYMDDPILIDDVGDNLPEYSLEFAVQRLQCPQPIDKAQSTILIEFTCKQCGEYDHACMGPRCDMPQQCLEFSTSAPDGIGPQRWHIPSGPFGVASARFLESITTDPFTFDPITVGTGTITAHRVPGFARFSTDITNNNGNLVSATYYDRADFAPQIPACVGGPASSLVATCDLACKCQSVLMIRTRLTQTVYGTTVICVNNKPEFSPQNISANPQDVILTYTGPLDGLLYDANWQGSSVRELTLAEVKIRALGTAQDTPFFKNYYHCDLPSPTGAHDIAECDPFPGQLTTSIVEVTDEPCDHFCGYVYIQNPDTGNNELFHVLTGEAGAELGFPATVSVDRTAW